MEFRDKLLTVYLREIRDAADNGGKYPGLKCEISRHNSERRRQLNSVAQLTVRLSSKSYISLRFVLGFEISGKKSAKT